MNKREKIDQLVEKMGEDDLLFCLTAGMRDKEVRDNGGKVFRRTERQLKNKYAKLKLTRDSRQFARLMKYSIEELNKVIDNSLAGIIFKMSTFAVKDSMVIMKDGKKLNLKELAENIGISNMVWLTKQLKKLEKLRVISINKTGGQNYYTMNPMYITNGNPLVINKDTGELEINPSFRDSFSIGFKICKEGYYLYYTDGFKLDKKLIEEVEQYT